MGCGGVRGGGGVGVGGGHGGDVRMCELGGMDGRGLWSIVAVKMSFGRGEWRVEVSMCFVVMVCSEVNPPSNAVSLTNIRVGELPRLFNPRDPTVRSTSRYTGRKD